MADRRSSLALRQKTDERKFRYLYQSELQQMMYVFGETQESNHAVTMLIEEIVKKHTTELIINSVAIARKRLSRYVAVDDVVFLIRHDRAKVNRLKDYLGWKDVRKNVKDDAGGAVAGEDLLADAVTGGPGSNGVLEEGAEVTVAATTTKMKKRVKFSWEYVKEFTDLLEDDSEDEDEEDVEAYRESLVRLKTADDITRNMTASEYIFYSECRTASFTHRKSKRFREWTSMANIVDSKPNDDIIDIFGFLAHEMVRKLTETALELKRSEKKALCYVADRVKSKETCLSESGSNDESEEDECQSDDIEQSKTTDRTNWKKRKTKQQDELIDKKDDQIMLPLKHRKRNQSNFFPLISTLSLSRPNKSVSGTKREKRRSETFPTVAVEDQVFVVPGGLFGLARNLPTGTGVSPQTPTTMGLLQANDGDLTISLLSPSNNITDQPDQQGNSIDGEQPKVMNDFPTTNMTTTRSTIQPTSPLRVSDVREAFRILQHRECIVNIFSAGCVRAKPRLF